MDDKSRQFLIKSGMQINDISPAEIARMREKVKPVVDKYTPQVGEALVKQFDAELAKARAAALAKGSEGAPASERGRLVGLIELSPSCMAAPICNLQDFVGPTMPCCLPPFNERTGCLLPSQATSRSTCEHIGQQRRSWADHGRRRPSCRG